MYEHVDRLAGALVDSDSQLEREFETRLTESSTLAFRVAYSVLRHRQDAEDVAQDTLRRVFEAIRANRIDNMEALPGFVFQTARNLCMHWVRSTAREKSAFARLERESVDSRGSPDALANLIFAERARAVKRAIDRLATDDRRLLAMIYYDDLGTDEIAARLGINASAVRVRKHRALQRLAVELGESVGNESGTVGTLE